MPARENTQSALVVIFSARFSECLWVVERKNGSSNRGGAGGHLLSRLGMDKKRKKLDLRHGGYEVKGKECVCMEIDIPDSDVVLSDFNAWHFVLNHMYLNPDCFDEETLDQDQRWLDSMTAEERERAIRSSWDAIFDIRSYENEWVDWGSYIQATFWELKVEQIRNVRFFRAR